MPTTLADAKKVMVVEDESIVSLDIKNSLTKLGYSVSGVAASGDIALTKMQDNRPDVVLMDIHIKGEMSGIDVSRRVKEYFQIPIVYLTANADSATFREAQETDPYGYVLKPFKAAELGIAIEIAINKHQKAQAVKSSERWYATAFQSLNEAVIATDSNGRIIFMNALAESLTEWTLAESLDLPLADVLRFQRKIEQFDRFDLKESVSSILSAVLRGQQVIPFPYNAQLATRSLTTMPIEGSAVVNRDASGQIIGSLFVFSKITPPDNPKSDSKSAIEDEVILSELIQKEQPSVEKPITSEDTALIKKLVEAFASGNQMLLSTPSLVATSGDGGTSLTSRAEGSILSVKNIEGKQTAVVKKTSDYWQPLRHFLVENSFFPVSQRTNGSCYFQYCETPDSYQIYHSAATELWNAWHGKTVPYQASSEGIKLKLPREKIVIFRRGSWQHIQGMGLKGDILHVKTLSGSVFSDLEDLLVWGAQPWKKATE